jgi:hypothetical protein
MNRKNIWVQPNQDGKWTVKSEGANRAGSVHDTQAEAIQKGRERAIENNGELFIKGRDGKIRDRDSYGNDPCPPKDTKH